MSTPFPLGRHEDAAANHDPRSRGFAAPSAAPIVNKLWRRYGYVLDQGNLGSCTGNAGIGCLNHAPFHTLGQTCGKEPDAVNLYSAATQIDPYDGTYPPTDTGSDGLSISKVLQSRGRITGYTHSFGLDHALAAAMYGPLIVGTNWYTSMFYPSPDGVVTVSGQLAGGHEYVLSGVDVTHRMLRFQNSWGSSWGDYGKFWMTFDSFASLLNEGGDVILFAR